MIEVREATEAFIDVIELPSQEAPSSIFLSPTGDDEEYEEDEEPRIELFCDDVGENDLL